jgi:hypothetical protein
MSSVAPEAFPASGTALAVEPTRFLLGTHQPHWLRLNLGVPLFVSDRRLRGYRALPRADVAWALDSGGFTELSTYGSWEHGPTPYQYVERVRRYRDEVGRLDWAAPQDWMCEPHIIARTGLTVAEHQARTVANYLRLRDLDTALPFIPVVQGWTPGDYVRCVERYAAHGVDLTGEQLVGVGSVCRRQSSAQLADILTALHQVGVTRLHGFGVKTSGLAHSAALLTSADSMAWSAAARRRPPLPGCTGHRNCANCVRYALRWQREVQATVSRAVLQPALFAVPVDRCAA